MYVNSTRTIGFCSDFHSRDFISRRLHFAFTGPPPTNTVWSRIEQNKKQRSQLRSNADLCTPEKEERFKGAERDRGRYDFLFKNISRGDDGNFFDVFAASLFAKPGAFLASCSSVTREPGLARNIPRAHRNAWENFGHA
jgi:hypothetical protein